MASLRANDAADKRRPVLTFHNVASLAPGLWKLEAEIKALRPKREVAYCAMEKWFGRHGYRRRMMEVVGWNAKPAAFQHPITRTCEAFDVAYSTLYAMLIARGGCPCCR
jgi:hypothetical protein